MNANAGTNASVGGSVLDATNYYRATANQTFASADPQELPQKVDVCVVGAGQTGLSAALELAKAGRSVAVFDKGPVGWGATGRNGGQICTGFSPGMAGFEKQLGRAEAQICFDVAQEAKALLRERVKAHAIQCDLTWGYIHAANKPSHMKGLEEHKRELESFGAGELAMLTRDELSSKLASDAYHGGLTDNDAGHMHTLNYALGLAQAVVASGGLIFENTGVEQVADGAPAELKLAGGRSIRCDQVVLACNGYLDGLVPRLDARVMPVASYVIATQPLGKARARGLISGNEAIADSNFVVDYFRLTADHRLLFGGSCSYSGVHPRDLAAYMRPRMLRIFPQLADVKIDHAWGGHIGITHNRMPDTGRKGKAIYYVHGFSGQGLILSGMMGKVLADAIMGEQARFDVFSRVRHLPFPGGILRRPALTLGMLYYRIRDLIS